jgi:hypothetical protein
LGSTATQFNDTEDDMPQEIDDDEVIDIFDLKLGSVVAASGYRDRQDEVNAVENDLHRYISTNHPDVRDEIIMGALAKAIFHIASEAISDGHARLDRTEGKKAPLLVIRGGRDTPPSS